MSRPIGSKNKPRDEIEHIDDLNEPEELMPVKWSGTARSMVCSPQGSFNNFRNVTLEVVNGIVVRMKESQPYALFEASALQEIDITKACDHLSFNYRDGKTWDR